MALLILLTLPSALAILSFARFFYQIRIASRVKFQHDRPDEPSLPALDNRHSQSGSQPSLVDRSNCSNYSGTNNEARRDQINLPAQHEPRKASNDSITPQKTPSFHPRASQIVLNGFTQSSPILISTPESDASSASRTAEDVFDIQANSVNGTPLTPPTEESSVKRSINEEMQSPSNLRSRAVSGEDYVDLRGIREDQGSDCSSAQTASHPSRPSWLLTRTKAFKLSSTKHSDNVSKSFSEDDPFKTRTENDRTSSTQDTVTQCTSITGLRTDTIGEGEIEASKKAKTEPSTYSEALPSEGFVETTKETMVATINIVLDGILPYKLLERLRHDPRLCVASATQEASYARCNQSPLRHSTESHSLDKTGSMFGIIKDSIDERNVKGFKDLIRPLLKLYLCQEHYTAANRRNRLGTLERFLKRPSRVQGDPRPLGRPSSIQEAELSMWLEAISISVKPKPSTVYGAIEAVQPKSKLSKIPSFPIGPLLLWETRNTKGKHVSQVVQEHIWTMLTNKEKDDGWIYVLKHYSDGRVRKIGTSKKPKERLEQWNRDCKRTHECDNILLEVPFALRIEKLIHAELKDLRRRIECIGCSTEHKKRQHCEWFEVPAEHMWRVIQKWTSWGKTVPYEVAFNNKYRLKLDVIRDLQEICEPLPFEIGPSRSIKYDLRPLPRRDYLG